LNRLTPDNKQAIAEQARQHRAAVL